MSTSLSSHRDPRAEQLATWSAVFGVVISLSLAAASGSLLLDQRAARATSLGALGRTVALFAPFVAPLVATRVGGRERKRATDVTGLDLTHAKGLTTEQLRDLAARGAQVESSS